MLECVDLRLGFVATGLGAGILVLHGASLGSMKLACLDVPALRLVMAGSTVESTKPPCKGLERLLFLSRGLAGLCHLGTRWSGGQDLIGFAFEEPWQNAEMTRAGSIRGTVLRNWLKRCMNCRSISSLRCTARSRSI